MVGFPTLVNPCFCQMARAGSAISCIRSLPTRASQRLSGSTLGDGMDWMIRNIVSVLAQSVA